MQNSSVRSRQWRQLFALTFAHMIADVYVGLIAPVLIPMRDRYGISLAALIVITSLLVFASNIFQIPVGHLRATWTRPWLIWGGVLLAGVSVFMPCLPATPGSAAGMAALAVLSGLGVATVHPEGLRAVHGLDAISSSLSTAVFMVAGFMGFSGGALLSATLTEHFGLESLMGLYLLAPLAGVPLVLSGVRLPVEAAKPVPEAPSAERTPSVPFGTLFAMAAVLATCSQIQGTLLPSYLHEEAGYSLSFSGLSFTLFGVGGMAGAVLWGALAPRLGHLRVLLATALVGAPLTALYLWLAPQTKGAAAVLAFTGFIVYTGFPLCVALARYADSSLRVSQRMGLISGGTWGVAAVVLWIIGPIAERTGLRLLLHLIWIGYLAAAAMTLFQMRRAKLDQ
ncbi:MAG: MFS transporter [Kiritimatiellia bacterium]|jgi:FSR family fosmidomycin resistance protein-like MFS transporter|nr:MFS transporter [Kiritimatiellia bacterium]MDD4443426.1 MFS transporter [Kiritimatiellia bacterium]NLC80176.1 MFS transporter [Lentisphaerota bacterium]